MSLVDELLSKLLAEQISDEDAEAPVGSELGRIAFASERPHKPYEENTEIEDKLHASIDDFLRDNIAIPVEHCQLIQKFLANDWYTDVFAKPEVDIVYRVMTVDEKWLRTALNFQEHQNLPEEGFKEIPYTYKSKRTCDSWSEDFDLIESYEGLIHMPNNDYKVIMFAKISDNPPNSFIACQNKLYDVVEQDQDAAEVISMIPLIEVFKIQWNIWEEPNDYN